MTLEGTRTDSALLRSRVYGLLRRLFEREVDAALLDWCREQGEAGLWSTLDMELNGALEVADSEAALEDLAVDFCQLFITSGEAGSPHESVHAADPEQKALLWGDSAAHAKDLYREAGFELEASAHQLPDALTVEFEFMERLCREEAALRETGEEGPPEEIQRIRLLQQRMLAEHLHKWVPDYGRKLGAAANTDFYRAMLNLAADFVEWDAEMAARD